MDDLDLLDLLDQTSVVPSALSTDPPSVLTHTPSNPMGFYAHEEIKTEQPDTPQYRMPPPLMPPSTPAQPPAEDRTFAQLILQERGKMKESKKKLMGAIRELLMRIELDGAPQDSKKTSSSSTAITEQDLQKHHNKIRHPTGSLMHNHDLSVAASGREHERMRQEMVEAQLPIGGAAAASVVMSPAESIDAIKWKLCEDALRADLKPLFERMEAVKNSDNSYITRRLLVILSSVLQIDDASNQIAMLCTQQLGVEQAVLLRRFTGIINGRPTTPSVPCTLPNGTSGTIPQMHPYHR